MNDCWLIYTDDDRYIGTCYDLGVAQRALARGCTVVPYLDHVRPECRPEQKERSWVEANLTETAP